MNNKRISTAIVLVTLLGACSSTPQPIVESIEQAKQSPDVARNIEQTMQKPQENQEKKPER